MNGDYSSLLSEVEEQILYLQELGVENLAVSLPKIVSKSPTSNVQRPTSEIPRERLEKFVPDLAELKMGAAEKPKVETIEQKPVRTNILSNLPSLKNRQTLSSNILQNNESREQNDMPLKKVAETPPESLFGDLQKTLPDANETLEEIRADIGNCIRCPLHEGRTKIVHSEGNLTADLMFIGEAPGADEDAQGRPFVGRSGQLLTKIIESIGLKREDVFIGNINRCRPPGNRTPTLPEAHTCRPFLLREIAVVRPKIIVVMGNTAMKNLLDTKEGITKLRGEFQDYFGVKVMPTFHPAYLLRDPSKKREVWEDMKKVRDELGKSK